MADLAMEVQEIESDLVPCHVCGRTFLAAPLKKHLKVCEKNATRKRKVFDSLKQRVEGTELAPFHQPTFLKKCDPDSNSPEKAKTNWKEKHQQLVQAIRAAKKVDPPTPSVTTPSPMPRRLTTTSTPNSRCPSCERTFGPRAFDRHVEWCRERSRTTRPPGQQPQQQAAKERLEARTKYLPPPLNKSRRSVTRDKYQYQEGRDRERDGRERKMSEPIIKQRERSTAEEKKDKCPKPKLNHTDINASVLGMTVHPLSAANLQAWSDQPPPKRKIPRYVPKSSQSLTDVKHNIQQILKTNESNIQIIKEPPVHFDTDSLCDSESILNTARLEHNLNSTPSSPKNNTNSEIFYSKTKFTSTPLEKRDFDSGSLVFRTEENHSLYDSSIIDLTEKIDIDKTTLVLDTEKIDIPEKDISEKLQIISDSYDLIAEINSPIENEEVEIIKPEIENVNEPVQLAGFSELKEFLSNLSTDRQVQLEVIATDVQSSDEKLPDLKIFRESSQEMVIQGENSKDIINKLLNENGIKSVNVVFLNETTKISQNSVKVGVNKIKRRTHKRKRKKDVKLPVINCNCDGDSKKVDKFWENVSQENSVVENYYHESKIHTKRKQDLVREKKQTGAIPDSLPPIIKDSDYNPFVIAEKQLQSLLDDSEPTKRGSVIQPPEHFQDLNNFELIENLLNDNFSEKNINLNQILSHRKYSDESIDPRLINEVDNLDIPEKIFDQTSPVSIDHYSEHFDQKISLLEKKNNENDLEDFISNFDDDSFPGLKNFLQHKTENKPKNKKIQKSTLSLNSSFGKSNEMKEKKNISPLKRSVSLSNPITKARSMKNKQDINDYLHVKDKQLSPKHTEDLELFPETHELYSEYKKFEEEYRREMQLNHQQDSAYSSLPRKSKLPQRAVSLERSSSSSGSEAHPTPKKPPHKSKFCHECGSKYPVDVAKFCVECGVKRLVL